MGWRRKVAVSFPATAGCGLSLCACLYGREEQTRCCWWFCIKRELTGKEWTHVHVTPNKLQKIGYFGLSGKEGSSHVVSPASALFSRSLLRPYLGIVEYRVVNSSSYRIHHAWASFSMCVGGSSKGSRPFPQLPLSANCSLPTAPHIMVKSIVRCLLLPHPFHPWSPARSQCAPWGHQPTRSRSIISSCCFTHQRRATAPVSLALRLPVRSRWPKVSSYHPFFSYVQKWMARLPIICDVECARVEPMSPCSPFRCTQSNLRRREACSCQARQAYSPQLSDGISGD